MLEWTMEQGGRRMRTNPVTSPASNPAAPAAAREPDAEQAALLAAERLTPQQMVWVPLVVPLAALMLLISAMIALAGAGS
ncbi:MAG TPA: hypothetical protein PKB14_25120 [Rubrivivax sp.]|nr:hypothetical protein [Rubrivivax sp.]